MLSIRPHDWPISRNTSSTRINSAVAMPSAMMPRRIHNTHVSNSTERRFGSTTEAPFVGRAAVESSVVLARLRDSDALRGGNRFPVLPRQPPESNDNEQSDRQIPYTRIAHAVVRHVAPQTVAIDDELFDRPPCIGERNADRHFGDHRQLRECQRSHLRVLLIGSFQGPSLRVKV